MTIKKFKIEFLDKLVRLVNNIDFIFNYLGLKEKQKIPTNLDVKAEELDLNSFFSEVKSILSFIEEDTHILRLAFAYDEPSLEVLTGEEPLPEMMYNLSLVESLSRRALNDLEITLTMMSDVKNDESSGEKCTYSMTFEGRSYENLSILDECLKCSNKILEFIDPVEQKTEVSDE